MDNIGQSDCQIPACAFENGANLRITSGGLLVERFECIWQVMWRFWRQSKYCRGFAGERVVGQIGLQTSALTASAERAIELHFRMAKF